MDAVNEVKMKQYFYLLEDTLTQNDLLNHPARIYNVDETGMPLDPKSPNILTKKGVKKVCNRTSGRKGQITVVACGNAAGQVIPPMVIYDAKKLNHAWTANEIPGTRYGLSDKGWITTVLFEGWLTEHFLDYAVPQRPLLLLLDGHSTHYQPEVIRLAREKEIIILCLPLHTTHETQPLDCGVFSSLKSHWSAVCHDFTRLNPGKVITKFNFNRLFSQAWLQAVVPANIMAGFKTCGVYPFNRSAIKVAFCDTQVDTSTISNKDANESNETCHSSDGMQTSQSPSHSPMPKETLDFVEFNEDQGALFLKRYEEGYDIFDDADYVRWLEINHPEVLPTHSSVSLLNDDDDNGGLSVVAHLSSISPQIPLPTADSGPNLSSDLTSHILSNERGCITNTSESISTLDHQETTPEMQTQNAKSSPSSSESTLSKFLVYPHLLDLKKYLVLDFSLVLCHLLHLRRRKERNKRNSKKKSEKKRKRRQKATTTTTIEEKSRAKGREVQREVKKGTNEDRETSLSSKETSY